MNATQNDFEYFFNLLSQRSMVKRKDHNGNISAISTEIVFLYSKHQYDKAYFDLIYEMINTIISECEIYYNMTSSKAFDAVVELSSYAAVFVGQKGYAYTYDQICKGVNDLRSSYPYSGDLKWMEAPVGYDEEKEKERERLKELEK